GDPVRLNQILINLISNAVKFTHAGRIQVVCSAEKRRKNGCTVKIEVLDTGVGVPSDKLGTIFESFSQADASVTRKYGGSGLGLTIVKQLVELQDGTIEVRSEEHKGSSFVVRVPYHYGESHHLKKTAVPKSTPSIDARTLRDVKILLVEDNDINRLYAKSILIKWQCTVDIAENGLVAIEKIKNNAYHVVLMDVQMPVMDGYEATRAIRLMDAPMRSVPIVALTANATKPDIEKCLAAGMNDYLPKPFTPDDLYGKIIRDLKIKTRKNGGVKKDLSPVKPAFDLGYLRSVSDNNEEFLREMIGTFVETIPPVLDEMAGCLSEHNWYKLSRLAHQIKPSFGLMGMDDLRKTVFFIEENADQKTNLTAMKKVASTFIEDCRSVIVALKNELPAV
ncbi:MAG TPA: ATP-binding protein, partial [Chryseosolibacter sp.]